MRAPTLTALLLLHTSIVVQAKIRVIVYYEPQDDTSTNFFRQQLKPLFQTGLREHLELGLVPYGRSDCRNVGTDVTCTCPHGGGECDLIYLQSCVLHEYRQQADVLAAITCTQGQGSFGDAFMQCIEQLPNAKWFKECAFSFRGRYLAWLQGLRTSRLQPTFTHPPMVTLNGRIDEKAVENLKKQVCSLMTQTLPDCSSVYDKY